MPQTEIGANNSLFLAAAVSPESKFAAFYLEFKWIPFQDADAFIMNSFTVLKMD